MLHAVACMVQQTLPFGGTRWQLRSLLRTSATAAAYVHGTGRVAAHTHNCVTVI